MITCRLIVGSIDVCVMLFCDGFLCADGTFCNCLVRGKIREARRERKRKRKTLSLFLCLFLRARVIASSLQFCVFLSVSLCMCVRVSRKRALCLSLSLFVSKFLLVAVSAATSDPARSSCSPSVHNRSTLIFAAIN